MRASSKECQVGVRGPAGLPELSVEKDFACLDDSDEDNRDTFTNSMESGVYELPPIHDLNK
jgi:hypothetical protein